MYNALDTFHSENEVQILRMKKTPSSLLQSRKNTGIFFLLACESARASAKL